jgi:Tfp pilus assembly protein PilF
LVQAYRQKGDVARAQQLLETVVGKNPATAEAHRALADLCAAQKLYDEAVKHYEQALRMSPNAAEVHNNLAWLYATSEDPKFRNPHAALDHARLAVDLTRWKQPEFLDTLAEAHYANQNFAEAVKVQTKALELDPHNPALQEHMARYRKAAGVCAAPARRPPAALLRCV